MWRSAVLVSLVAVAAVPAALAGKPMGKTKMAGAKPAAAPAMAMAVARCRFGASCPVTVKGVRFTFRVGPAEQMSKSMGMTTKGDTEIMSCGSMGAMGATARHVEVHISQGGVVEQAPLPRIVYAPVAGGRAGLRMAPMRLPVACMYGAQAGMADFHFGNNVALMGGKTYEVEATWKRVSAAVDVTIPAGGGAMKMK